MNAEPDRDDSGSSLIELLIAMMILGTAVVAIVSGIGTAVVVSVQNRQQTQAAVAVRSYAEAIGGRYVACATPSTAAKYKPKSASNPTGVEFTAPAGFTASVLNVDYLPLNGGAFGPMGSCAASDLPRLQRVRLQVASTTGNASAQIDVMLRKPCRIAGCPNE